MDHSLNSTSALSETLERLAGKAGVQSTMVLERSSSTILQATGSFLQFRGSQQAVAGDLSSTNTATLASSASTSSTSPKDEGMEAFATMVWNFVNTTGNFVHGLDSEDDAKLLRLRTKKHELVIVPDAKYIFIVVHDTSQS